MIFFFNAMFNNIVKVINIKFSLKKNNNNEENGINYTNTRSWYMGIPYDSNEQ